MATENLPATKQSEFPAIAGTSSIFLNMQRFSDAQRVATMLSTSTLIPDHFRGNIGNCVIALNLAERLNVDPFMMMQTMYVVHGRPGIEGKLAIALIEGTGRFSPLKYRFAGKGKTGKGIDRADSCVAYATELKTGEVIEGPIVTWQMAEIEGWLKDKGAGNTSKWHTMPDLMFRYRAAMFFARVNCPGALLGLRTTDELEDIDAIEMTPAPNGTYQAPSNTIDEGPGPDLTIFNKSIPEGTDPAILEDFLTRTAKANGASIDSVKAEALKDLPAFWKVFGAYQKQVQAKNAKERKDTKGTSYAENQKSSDDTPPRFDCPNGGFANIEFCKTCNDRENDKGEACTAYMEHDPASGQ